MRKELDKKAVFENMPVNKAILTLAVPTIISQLINLIYNIVDTMFIGRVGDPLMLGGVSVSMSVYLLCIAFANLYGIGGGSLIARLIGKKEDQEVKKVASYSILFAVISAAVYSLVCIIFNEPLLRLMGASEEVLPYAKQYVLFVVIIGNIPNILGMVLAHLLRNVGKATESSLGLSIGGCLNIILDPLFMFVIMPEGLEVMGAAIATLLSTMIGCAFLLYEFIKSCKTTPLGFSLKAARKINKTELKEIYAVGIPSALLTAMVDLGNIFLNKLMFNHGNLEGAAIGIVMKAERLPNAINIGLCQGMLPIVAYNYASHNEKRRQKVVNRVRLFGLCNAGLGLCLYLIFAEPIVKLFLSTETGNVEDSLKTIEFAAMFLQIRCFVSPFQFLNFHTSYCMQAMGDGKGTMLHAFSRICIFYIPLMLLLDYMYGEIGVVSAFVLSECLGAIVALILLKSFTNKKQKERAMFSE